MATVTATLHAVADALGISRPSSFTGSAEPDAVRLLRAWTATGRYLALSRNWRCLVYEAQLTTVAGTTQYSVPANPSFHHYIPGTAFDRSNNREVLAPESPQAFQRGRADFVDSGLRHEIRFAQADNRTAVVVRFVDDPQGAYDIRFEYATDQWVNQGGSVFSTAPVADSNTHLFDDYVFEAHCLWRTLRALGEPYFSELDEAKTVEAQAYGRENAAPLSMRPRTYNLSAVTPEGNWT